MNKITSSFYYAGIFFSFFAFVIFLLFMCFDSQTGLWSDILVLLTGIVFICCLFRFFSQVINSLTGKQH